MKIRVCKTYTLDQMLWEFDSKCARQHENLTYKSDYNSVFETEDVDGMIAKAFESAIAECEYHSS